MIEDTPDPRSVRRCCCCGSEFATRSPTRPFCRTCQEVEEVEAEDHDTCWRCGHALQTGPSGFTDCPACNPDPARG